MLKHAKRMSVESARPNIPKVSPLKLQHFETDRENEQDREIRLTKLNTAHGFPPGEEVSKLR